MKLAQLGLCMALVAAPAIADEHTDCPLTYDIFEAAVPHTDLEECPASMDVEAAFCRVSVIAELATVFAFDEDSTCLMAARLYDESEFTLTLN